MRSGLRRLFPTTFFIFILFFTAYAQERGNIVEYFGRERVEQIEEGNVFHVFTDGLVLSAVPFGSGLAPARDLIAWSLAGGTYRSPQQGQQFQLPEESDSVYVWNTMKANEESLFTGREMRRSYLYTTFDSPRSDVVLLDAKGHTRVYINGLPNEGDHYDFGYTLIPFKLKKGKNDFIYTPGRFGRVSSKLVSPRKPVMLTRRDMTLPSLINGEPGEKWAAIRVINATEKDLRDLTIQCVLETGEEAFYSTGSVMALSVRKLKFLVPAATAKQEGGSVKASVVLKGKDGREIDRAEITLNQHDAGVHHERTFVSRVDGSVQYYSVAPSTVKGPGQALVLSVHGAGVEAKNQSRAYEQKDWCHVVAATNRRPYGFNWEEWGRIDGMEVLSEAKKVFQTSPGLTYLTGHSMGGHGSWYLGVTYPDHFAAIAPCAGYPDILGYRRGGMSERYADNGHFKMLSRSANGARTLDLKRNYLQSGIYILHGDDDTVVPVSLARMMRETLGEFHPNFCYYEYPGGSHWYGNHSVDWHAIFSYFKWHAIPEKNDVKHIEFHTASPAISASNYWITVNQQEKPLEFSSVTFDRKGDTIIGKAENVANLSFQLASLKFEGKPVIIIDDQTLYADPGEDLVLAKKSGSWVPVTFNPGEKHPGRYGGFKQAFDNHAVLVYATGGSREENEWYRNKARFDAEAFLYKGNGSFETVSDKEFMAGDYAGRNVILYGNAANNLAWKSVLQDCPVVVKNNEITLGTKTFSGDDLGACFIYPRSGSDVASVGVVAGTGVKGMKATYGNDYFSGVNGYPDLLIFNTGYLKDGLEGILVSGFFDSDWSIGEGFHQ